MRLMLPGLLVLALGMAALRLALRRDDEPGAPEAVSAGRSLGNSFTAPLPATSERRDLASEAPPRREAADALDQPQAPAVSGADSKPAVQQKLSPLVDSGLAQEVADGMLACAAQQVSQYKATLAQRPDSTYRHQLEFLLALWPELASLLKAGKVRLQVAQRGASGNAAPVFFRLTDGDLDIVMSTPNNWVVTMSFTSADNPFPDIYRQIEAASKKAHGAVGR